jgi:hypothetical protein
MPRQIVALVLVAASAFVALASGGAVGSMGADTVASEAPLRPEDIYLRAMRAMRALPQPKYVIFRADYWARNAIVTCGADGLDLSIRHGDFFSTYRVWYRVADETSVTVDPKSHSRCDDSLIVPAGTEIDALGQGTPTPAASPTGTAGPSETRIIATVRVESVHFYRVALAGFESIDGHDAYHLVLQAYRNPLEHPLTDVWVDTSSWLIRRVRAEVSLHLVIASAHGVFVGSFNRYGTYWMLDNEHIEIAGNATFVHLRSTLNARASDFSFPEQLPDGVFPSPTPSHARK